MDIDAHEEGVDAGVKQQVGERPRHAIHVVADRRADGPAQLVAQQFHRAQSVSEVRGIRQR